MDEPVDPAQPAGPTFCDKMGPKVAAAAQDGWGPTYQRDAHPAACGTKSWQLPAPGSKGIFANPENRSSGFWCQASQPVWSAHRSGRLLSLTRICSGYRA